MRILLNWLLSALAVEVVAHLVPGFHVSGVGAALIAALIIGLVNATLGLLLKIITLPLTILTLGVFWFVINALMLELASAILSPAFRVDSFASAFCNLIRWSQGVSFGTMKGSNPGGRITRRKDRRSCSIVCA